MADGREQHVWTQHAREHAEIKEAHKVSEDYCLRQWLKEVDPKGPCVDWGCGSGLWKNLFNGYQYFGVDQNPEMLRVARERWPEDKGSFIQVDWYGSTMNAESVDLIFTSAVIQHNLHEQKDKVVQEFRRLLKPGGYYLCTETTFSPSNYSHAAPGVPYSEDFSDGYSFTKSGWERYMKRHGFELVHFAEPSEYLWRKL